MSARCGAKPLEDEERLPMFHRTVRLPAELWRGVKERGQRKDKAIRRVVDDALDAELVTLVERLRRAGLKGERNNDKLVRVPLDDNVIGRLNWGRRQTGIAAVQLLRMCLERHAAKRDH